MATLQEIIYNIKNLRRNGRVSDDDSISDRQWAFIINYYRAKLIKQDTQKKRGLSGNIIQNLGKVRVIKADKNECCDIEDCILRIELPLPKAIDTDNQPIITFVGLLNHTKSFQRTTMERAIWDQYARYTGKEPKWFQIGNYIYLVNPPTKILKYINIQGVFEDPTQALKYRTCDCPDNEEACYQGFDYEYPLAIDKLDTVVKMIMDAEAKILNILKQDTSNDTQDDN